VQFMTLCGIIL